MEFKNEWRRFEIVEPSKEQDLMNLLERRNINRKDLILILKTIKLRNISINQLNF